MMAASGEIPRSECGRQGHLFASAAPDAAALDAAMGGDFSRPDVKPFEQVCMLARCAAHKGDLAPAALFAGQPVPWRLPGSREGGCRMNPSTLLPEPPGVLPPVTPEQAERNAALLEAELIARETERGHHMHGTPKLAARRRAWGES